MTLPLRPLAHTHKPLRALPAPCHAVTSTATAQPTRSEQHPQRLLTCIVHYHTLLTYVELHYNEKATTVTLFLERTLTFFAQHHIVAKPLITYNLFSYVKNRSLRELLTH